MDNHEVVIQVRNVSKSFRVYFDKGHMLKEKLLFNQRNKFEKREILKDISFDIYKGETVGLIGLNGCGKSTALKLLTRIMYPDSGDIHVKGRVSSLLELGAGFHPDLSGRENIYINASIFGLKRNEIDARINDIVEFSELGDYIDNPVRTYSSGMYMRLAFSVAINVEADILLVDEILAVGDAGFQTKCLKKINEIKKNGTTIVLVSHSMNQIQAVCDRCIWINDGNIAAIGDTDKVINSYSNFVQELEKQKVVENLSKSIEEKKNISKVSLLETQLFDKNNADKSIWGIGEQMRIVVKFSCSLESLVNIRMEIVRADGILAYAIVADNDGKGYLLPKENELQINIDTMNLLAGKFMIIIYFENNNGEMIGSIVPAKEFDIVDNSRQYGIARMENVNIRLN